MESTAKPNYEELLKLCLNLKADFELQNNKYKRLENELNKVQKITHIGTWYLDLATNEVTWTEELYKMYGFDPNLPVPPYTEHMKLFTKESWDLLSKSLANTAKTGIPYQLELNTVRKDGSKGWMWVRGEAITNSKKEIVGLWGAAQDISKEKEVEIGLIQRERLLNEMGKMAKVGGWQIDLLTNKLTWTDEVYKIHEVNSDFKPTVENAIDFYYGSSRHIIENALNKAIETGEKFNVDLNIKTARGNIKNVHAIGRVILGTNGKPEVIYGSFQDNTAKKIKEEELLKNQYYLSKAQEIGKIGTWELDIANNKLFWTKANFKNFGVKFGTPLSYETFLNCVHPDDKEYVNQKWTAALKGKPYEIEHRIIANGKVKWLIEKAEIRFNENGEAVSAIGFTQDITKIKDNEKRIKDLSEIIENSVNEIYLFDIDSLKFVYVNESATKNLGYTFDELKHKTPIDIKPEFDSDRFYQLLVPLRQNKKKSLKFETIHQRKDGSLYNVSVTIQISTYKASKVFSAIIIDISERKRFENEMIKSKEIAEENEQKFRALYDKSPDMFISSYLDNNEVFMCNETFLKKTNYSKDDIIGKQIFILFKDDAIERVKTTFEQLNTIGIINNEESILTTKDGENIHISINASSIKDSSGRIIIISSLRDISERVKLREKQQRDKQLLNETGRLAKIGGWELDVTTMKSYYSQETKRIYGIPLEAEPPSGIDGIKYYPKEARDLLQKLVDDALNNGSSYDIEVPFINEQGKELWVRTIGHAEKKNGKVVRLYGTLQDISEQKSKEQRDIKFSKAIEQSPNCIVLTDVNGIIEYVNNAFTTISGYSKQEAIGQKISILSSGSHDLQFYQRLWDDLKNGKIWTGEFCNKKKNGDLYWESANISPVFDKNGKLINYLAIKEDITKTKILINELQEAKSKAEESDKLKSAFLANMSHEIRTPMNGIIGFTELLQDPDLSSDNQKDFLRIIQNSCQRLLNTVNDIIEISKIESGMVVVSTDKFEIAGFLDSLVAFFKPEAQSKKLDILIKNENIPDQYYITTDKNKLNSIISNLIKNAIKYTDRGYIKVGFKLLDNQLIFYCEDTGIGIPHDRHKAIFNRFEQAEMGDARVFEGTGLGLSIVKAYVEMIGAKIWLNSDVNIGSKFYVSLQQNRATHNQRTFLDRAHNIGTPFKDIRLLIAEDDENSALHLSLITKNLFKKVEIVRNGFDALTVVKNNPSFDLILIDIRMPNMNGLEATKKIREFNSEIIIIAQTAYAFEEDKATAIEAGCNDFISKPIRKERLFEIISKYF